jgi:hypothetical protein
MKNALEIAALLSKHALAVFDLMGADASLKASRKLWSWIIRNRKPQFAFREAHQALRGTFSRVKDLWPRAKILGRKKASINSFLVWALDAHQLR